MQVPPKTNSCIFKTSPQDQNPFRVIYNYRKTKMLRKARELRK